MVITYYGGEFFKFQVGDVVIGYNPPSKNSAFKSGKFGADIALISMKHDDFNDVGSLTYGEKVPFVISGAGEYEKSGVSIRGFEVVTTYGGKQKMNTIYTVLFENISLCLLGAIASPAQLNADLREKIGQVEILFVPIGGGDVLSPSDAYSKVAVSLEPNIIIPMHYNAGSKELQAFLKEAANSSEEMDKLTIKKKDLAEKTGHIIALTPATSA
jgi:hypothetical protein